MTPRETILEQLAFRETRPVPYTLGFEGDVAERLDAHYGGPDWRKRIVPYLNRANVVDTGFWTPPVQDGLVTDRFGSVWRLDRRPFHLVKTALEKPSFAGYRFPAAGEFMRDDWLKAARRSLKDNPDSYGVGTIMWGLFETCWQLRGLENLLADFVEEPGFVSEAIERVADIYVDLVHYTAQLPLDAIMFGDDWGDQRGIIVGPQRWREIVKPAWARVYRAVKSHGLKVITHCCGSIDDIYPDLIEIGLDVHESVQPEAAGMKPKDLKRKWGGRMVFWGCLGSQSTIPRGTPDEIRTQVRRLCSVMGKDGGYILAPAKDLQPETPTGNAVAVFEAFTEQP